jgi:molybdenum cofactor cytidylyltransferase
MITTETPQVGAILLAAGASRRLGHPKQLIVYEGKTLIRRTAEMLVASKCDPVIVVLGAVVGECRREIGHLPVSVCINEKWNIGISTSIVAGITFLADTAPDVNAALIALCDQPFLTPADYNALIDEFTRFPSSIVAAAYDGVVGVPAIFSNAMFADLRSLKGDEGARHLVRHYQERTIPVEISGAAFDVDTPEGLSFLERYH